VMARRQATAAMFLRLTWVETLKACLMPRFAKSLVSWSFPLLFVSSGSIAAPECDSIESRKAVLQFVLGDGNNPLGTYAAKNSTAGKASAAAKPQISKKRNASVSAWSEDRDDVNEQGQADGEM
jgi:hypothetical protein